LEKAASRELTEETGLSLVNIASGAEKPYPQVAPSSELSVFHPVVCVIDAIQNHIGIAIVVIAEGELASTKEASSHGWHTASEVLELLAQGRVFPLNVPMLKEFLSSINSKEV
jgi:ADP-ribose pyrophosphatase YjhB (NUDIX family)